MNNKTYKTPPSKANFAKEVEKWIKNEVSTPQKAKEFMQKIGIHNKAGKIMVDNAMN
jgi:hypothetical protein